MARLVMFTSGTLGDHLPYLALGQELQARGHDVLMVINQAMHKYAERAGLKAVALTDVERGPEEARENAWAWDHWRNPWHQAQAHPKAKAQPPELFVRQVHELAGALDGADLLLATAIRPHGLAAHLISDVPWLTVSVNPSSFYQPPHTAERERTAGSERLFYNGIRPLIDRAVREAGSKRLVPGWYRGCLWAPQVILGSSPEFSRPDRDFLQPYTSVNQAGFWYWEDPSWADWFPSPQLEAICDQSPLVLTFSSQPLEEPRAILHKHIRAAAQLNLPLVVQRGWAGFDDNDLPAEIDTDRVLFLDYAPHDWLFARASVAIQHGGIGSLARAIRQFCPVIVEPFGNDQFFNANRTAELGVGVALHPFEATEADLAEAIQAARSKQARLRVRLLGRKLRDEDGVGIAGDLIERALTSQGSGPESRLPLWKTQSAPRDNVQETMVTQEIPQIIHHIWRDKKIPDHFEEWYQSWRTHHPQWEFHLWTDEEGRALIADHYGWFLAIYDAYSDDIKRVDALRYFVLYHCGGLYVDLDYEALRPIGPLFEGRDLVLTPEPPAHLQAHVDKLFLDQLLCNALMASTPGHPFWEHVFQLLVTWRQAPGPLDATGPFLLSRAYDSFGAKNANCILPYQILCPISSSELWPTLPVETRALISHDAYAIHHWYGSWWVDPVVSDQPVMVQLMMKGQAPLGNQQTTRDALLGYSARAANRPLVSCLMVTRERPLLAQLAINCFQRQSYAERELIIVDDAADDELARWLAENPDPRIRYVRLADEGRSLGELRTLALQEARGDYIAQWDDDDLSAPLRLELQMAALSLFAAEACMLARQLLWIPAMGSLAKSTYRLWEGSAVLPRALISGFPALRIGEDTAVVEQIAANERVVLLDMPELYLYTFHGRNTFDENHWMEHLQQATVRYEGFRYEPVLDTLQNWMGVQMKRLGSYLTQHSLPGSVKSSAAPLPKTPRQLNLAEKPPRMVAPDKSSLPELLILTPIKDAAPHLSTFLANLRKLDYPPELLSLAFLESDSRDHTVSLVETALPGLRQHFKRVEFLRRDYGLHLDVPRWQPHVQRLRRGVLARSRNALMQGALHDERWVLWIDVDVIEWPPDIIQQLLACSERIVTPNCLHAQGEESFDLNSYQLAPDANELDWSPYEIDGLLQPPRGFGRLYLNDFRNHNAVPLDGVGGTMLLVDADLHRDGLIFPPISYKGYVDTEGLAVMARDMGVRSWGLPNVIIRHTRE